MVRPPQWSGNGFQFWRIAQPPAYNRNLGAGTLLGSGTFSNRDHAEAGSSCLAERRALEIIAHGKAQTPFITFGERLRFEMLDSGAVSVFGAIENRYVAPGTSKGA